MSLAILGTAAASRNKNAVKYVETEGSLAEMNEKLMVWSCFLLDIFTERAA